MARMYVYSHILLPEVEEKDYEKSAYKKIYAQLVDYLERSNVKNVSDEIALAVVREGAYYGYERDFGEEVIFQKLPPEYCRTRFKVGGIYAMEFDFSFFDQFRDQAEKEEMFKSLPKEFKKLYNKYLSDRDQRWALLDPTHTRVHLIDDEIPMFASVFPDLLELEEYKDIDKRRSKLRLYKLLVQKIPTNDEGEIMMLLDDVVELHENARGMVTNSDIDVITTPAPIDAIDLVESQERAQDDVARATNAIYTTAGTPMSLFNIGNKTGSVGLDASVKVDEAMMSPLLSQFETWYNVKFMELSPKYKFKMIFPNITIFNSDKKFKDYQTASATGFPTKLLAMTALGISSYQTDALINFENQGLKLHERMIPTQSAFQPGGEGGRPESEDPLTDEGERTRDGNKNDGRGEEVG